MFARESDAVSPRLGDTSLAFSGRTLNSLHALARQSVFGAGYNEVSSGVRSPHDDDDGRGDDDGGGGGGGCVLLLFVAVLLTLQTGRVHCSAFAGVSASFITPAFSVRSSSADGARTRRWCTTTCLPVYVPDRTPIIQNRTVEPLVHEGKKPAIAVSHWLGVISS
ncbi:hypothetical protein WN51_09991 [Melipona quadrifasciata]|uniref:Uncharacterized protein n=1 Tax=Melipona quadrifasciata TaxID=166423 RepID=A0A0M9ACI9_9HYME|nr:hypothetical protein WN51_09991 [Melipona quadrifasciata]